MLSAEEAENSDNDTVFIQSIHIADPANANTGFDDLLEFVSDSFPCAKMVDAGVL